MALEGGGGEGGGAAQSTEATGECRRVGIETSEIHGRRKSWETRKNNRLNTDGQVFHWQDFLSIFLTWVNSILRVA
jgi:hypothetical protein